MTSAAFLAAAQAALAARKPGGPYAREIATERPLRPASVLIPLFEAGSEAGVLLVRRSEHLGKHPGQIAFPGGGREPGEDDLASALRESQEEIGLLPELVEIVGRLDSYPTVTDYLVSPFVGRLRSWPVALVADPSEVAAILEVPIDKLIEPGVLRVSNLGAGRTVDFFDVGDDQVIWGATAHMLRQLLELALGRPLVPSGEVPWEKVRW